MFQIKVTEVILQSPDLLARRDDFGAYYLTVDPTNPKIFNLLFGKRLCPELSTPFLNIVYGAGRIKPSFTTEISPKDDEGKRGRGSVLSFQDFSRRQNVLVVVQCFGHMYRKSWETERERIQKLRRGFLTDGIAEHLYVFFSDVEQDLDGVNRSGEIYTQQDFGIPKSDVHILVSYFPTRLTAVVEPELIQLLHEKCGSKAQMPLDRLRQALEEPFDLCYREKKLSANYCGALDKIFDNFRRTSENPLASQPYFDEQMDLLRPALDPEALYLYLGDKYRQSKSK